MVIGLICIDGYSFLRMDHLIINDSGINDYVVYEYSDSSCDVVGVGLSKDCSRPSFANWVCYNDEALLASGMFWFLNNSFQSF